MHRVAHGLGLCAVTQIFTQRESLSRAPTQPCDTNCLSLIFGLALVLLSSSLTMPETQGFQHNLGKISLKYHRHFEYFLVAHPKADMRHALSKKRLRGVDLCKCQYLRASHKFAPSPLIRSNATMQIPLQILVIREPYEFGQLMMSR